MSSRPAPHRRCLLRLLSTYQLSASGDYAWEWVIVQREPDQLTSRHDASNDLELLRSVASSTAKSFRHRAPELVKQTPGLEKYLASLNDLEVQTRQMSARLAAGLLAESGPHLAPGASCWLELSWVAGPSGEDSFEGVFALSTIGGESVAHFNLATGTNGRLRASEGYDANPAALAERSTQIRRMRQRAIEPMREFLAEIF